MEDATGHNAKGEPHLVTQMELLIYWWDDPLRIEYSSGVGTWNDLPTGEVTILS